MSLYVHWTNRVKELADESWLTPHQHTVYEAVTTRFAAHPFVNIHGKKGSGKSFLARMLSKMAGYVLADSLEQAPDRAEQVVLDDADYDRRMRPNARFKELGRVILMTEMPIRDAMPKLALELDAQDVTAFMRNLSESGILEFTQTIPEGADLGEMLIDEAVARGRANVAQ